MDVGYSKALRSLGQDLEARGVDVFDIESRNGAYFVHDRALVERHSELSPDDLKKSGGEPVSVWLAGGSRERRDLTDGRTSFGPTEWWYSSEDLDRLERAGQSRRRDPNGTPDAYSLSQLLRAVGAYVNHQGIRLCGICWRDQWVALVYETREGQRELEVLRRSSIYDFWVRMFLLRGESTVRA